MADNMIQMLEGVEDLGYCGCGPGPGPYYNPTAVGAFNSETWTPKRVGVALLLSGVAYFAVSRLRRRNSRR